MGCTGMRGIPDAAMSRRGQPGADGSNGVVGSPGCSLARIDPRWTQVSLAQPPSGHTLPLVVPESAGSVKMISAAAPASSANLAL